MRDLLNIMAGESLTVCSKRSRLLRSSGLPISTLSILTTLKLRWIPAGHLTEEVWIELKKAGTVINIEWRLIFLRLLWIVILLRVLHSRS